MMYTIGQIARALNISSQTLRRWELAEIIPAAKRTHLNKWRVWNEEDLKFIEDVVEQRSN